MAESELPTAVRDDDATVTLYDANEDGNWYSNRQRTYLVVSNQHTTTDLTVTIAEQRSCGHAHHQEEHGLIDSTKLVPQGATVMLGPFGRVPFGDASNRVHVTYSFTKEAAATVVGVAAIYDAGPAPAFSS